MKPIARHGERYPDSIGCGKGLPSKPGRQRQLIRPATDDLSPPCVGLQQISPWEAKTLIILDRGTEAEGRELEPALMKLGFKHDTRAKAPLCRWILDGLTVDMMPTDPEILGFSNQWYPDGIANRVSASLPSGKTISIFPTEYFVASKIEAFRGRGNDDLRTSHDFEDIVFVLDGRTNTQKELLQSTDRIRSYLKSWAQELFMRADLDEALSSQFNHGEQGRAVKIRDTLRRLAV